jgi:prepilin-type N-terminal cleavage/methylation domain-containing protein
MQLSRRHNFESTAGFTLIELLVVIVIIGILATLAIPRFSQLRVTARETQTAANLAEVQRALEAFGVDNNSLYPFRVRWYEDGNYDKPGFDPSNIAVYPPDLHSEPSAPWFSLGLFGGVHTVNPDFTDNTVPTGGENNIGVDENKVIQPYGWTYGTFYRRFNQYSDPLVALGYLGAYPENPFLSRPMGAIMWGYGDPNFDGGGPSTIDKSIPNPGVVPTPGDFVYTFFYGVENGAVELPSGISPARKSYQAKSSTVTDTGLYYLDMIDSYQLWAYGALPINGATYVNYPNNAANLSTKGRQVADKDWDNSGQKDMFEIGLQGYYKRTGSGATQSRDSSGKQLEF